MARSTGNSNEELPARLDALLSSAIRERARDERALAEVFGGMRQDLEAFGRDLTFIRKLVQRPFQPILTLLESKLGEVQAVVSSLRDHIYQRLDATARLQIEHVMQESRAVGKFVEEWSKYLDARVKEEAVGVRTLLEESAQTVQRRLTEESIDIKATLEVSKERAAKDLERHMKATAAGLSKMSEQIHLQLAGTEEALRADVEAAQEALLEGIEDSSEALSEVLTEVPSVVQKQIAESMAEGLLPFSKQAGALVDRIEEASRRIADSNSALEAIQSSLISYMAERDEKLERVRDQALIDLVERMSEALKGRTKTKIIDALREGDRRRKDERDAARYRESIERNVGGSDGEDAENSPNPLTNVEATPEGGPWLSDFK